jgi:hypothetical protein
MASILLADRNANGLADAAKSALLLKIGARSR